MFISPDRESVLLWLCPRNRPSTRSGSGLAATKANTLTGRNGRQQSASGKGVLAMGEWLYCCNCKTPLEDDEVLDVWVELTDDPRDRILSWECPYCHSDDICEAAECVVCGRVLPLNKINFDTCDDCVDKYVEECKKERIDING